jgi:hypothetical protein
MWDVQDPEPIDHRGMTECDVPGDESAEVVPDDVGGFSTLAVDQFTDISC